MPISLDSLKILTLLSGNWFIKSYFILYLIAPALNLYINYANKKACEMVIISLLSFTFIYGWLYPAATEWMCWGYSPIWFICLYLVARYTNKYEPWYSKFHISAYIVAISLLSIVLTGCCMLWAIISPNNNQWFYQLLFYDSPTSFINAILFICLINNVEIKNRVINRLGQSSFAVYLVFCSPLLLPIYVESFCELYSAYQGILYWGITLVSIFGLYVATASFDSIRICLWNKIVGFVSKKCIL